MTEHSKKIALQQIESLEPLDITNLWHGLRVGLELLANAAKVPENIQALYVLTDGDTLCLIPVKF